MAGAVPSDYFVYSALCGSANDRWYGYPRCLAGDCIDRCNPGHHYDFHDALRIPQITGNFKCETIGGMGMYLCDGRIGNDYQVTDIKLPVNIEKRLEALGI